MAVKTLKVGNLIAEDDERRLSSLDAPVDEEPFQLLEPSDDENVDTFNVEVLTNELHDAAQLARKQHHLVVNLEKTIERLRTELFSMSCDLEKNQAMCEDALRQAISKFEECHPAVKTFKNAMLLSAKLHPNSVAEQPNRHVFLELLCSLLESILSYDAERPHSQSYENRDAPVGTLQNT